MSTCIAKRKAPIIILLDSTFANQLFHLFNYFCSNYLATVEKARKVAEDKNYTSCEESQLGKGFRTRIPNKQINSDHDSEEDKEDERKKVKSKVIKKKSTRNIHPNSSDSDNNNNTQEIEKKKPELPQWPNTDYQRIDQPELLSQSILSTSDENNDDGKYS